MNSELEKLIEKYRITVNGLADIESNFDQVIKERGFVTLNGLLVSGESAATHSPSGEENTPVADPAPVEPTPVVPAPSEPATEQPGVTPVNDGPVSGDTNLGNESAENAVNTETHSPSGEVVSGERSADENTPVGDTTSTEDPAAGGKPKKGKK